jgi:hypothetical protein
MNLNAIPSLSRTTRAIALGALMGVGAAAGQSQVSATGQCPTDFGSCTTSCFWQGGCGCSVVGCITGNKCQYTSCNTDCCTECTGPNCT